MLLYFILGIVLVTIILPLIENIMSVFAAWTEYLVYKFAYKIYNLKKEMGEEEEEEKRPMGFQTQAIGYQVNDIDILQEE